MVDITTERTHRIDGTDYIAIKRSTWVNGVGKRVTQIVEEHDLTRDEIENVINVEADAELKNVNAEIEKLTQEIAEVRAEHQEVFDSEEYQKFKEMLKEEKYRKFFQHLNTEREVVGFEGRLKEMQKTVQDIENWRAQMIALHEELDDS